MNFLMASGGKSESGNGKWNNSNTKLGIKDKVWSVKIITSNNRSVIMGALGPPWTLDPVVKQFVTSLKQALKK
jgi:hypothetical protein